MITEAQTARVQADWSAYAQESVSVEAIGGTFYGFTSELGALRIANKYRYTDQDAVRAAYSAPRGSWYFSLTPKH